MVEGRATAPDGVELVYDVRGKGSTTLVFVHCWACDRTYWKNQLDEFAKTYRVVSLDLGGHGQSGDNRAQWTISSLGGDVQAVVEKLDLKNVILVGHSMGGPVSLDAARRMPGRVRGIACIETLHDVDAKLPPALRDQIIKGFETDYEGTLNGGIKLWFREGTDPAVVDFARTKALAAKKQVVVPLIRELMHLDLGPMLAAVKVPIQCVNAAPYGPFSPATNIAGNRKYNPQFDALMMDGIGHFPHLEQPEGLNVKLQTIIKAIIRSNDASGFHFN